MFKALIFDLDDTLLETYDLLIPLAARKACLAMIAASAKSPEEKNTSNLIDACMKHWVKLHFQISGLELFKKIALQILADETLGPIGFESFLSPDLPTEIPFAKSHRELLQRLSRKYNLYLVTQGLPQTQAEKVKRMNIEEFFKLVFIVNTLKGETKTSAFKQILKLENVAADQLLSVGNRLAHEIALSKQLGIRTCHILKGEHRHEKPQNQFEIADWTIQQLEELEGTCQL